MAEMITMPKLGFDMAEGVLVRWVISTGEKVSKGAVLAEIETDKATVEVEANTEGILLQHVVEQGAVVPVGAPIALIGKEGEVVESTSSKPVETSIVEADLPAVRKGEGRQAGEQVAIDTGVGDGEHLPDGVRASPLARRMADERGLDLQRIPGSGPKGRVTKEDVEAFILTPSAGTPAAAPTTGAGILQQVSQPEVDQRVPLSKLRAIIGKRMTASTQNVPHFFITHEFNAEPLLGIRAEVNRLLAEDQKTSVNDYIVRAVALTLREFPNLNASIDEGKTEIIQHGAVNVGVAVALENGLITVVCKDTDRKGIHQISQELRNMVQRARDGKVRQDDIEGSTFSISNLGMFDVEQFTAIINPPEAAILAVGSARDVPVVVDGELTVGKRVKATLSVDHRVSDGAEGAKFLQAMAKYLEEPLRLFL